MSRAGGKPVLPGFAPGYVLHRSGLLYRWAPDVYERYIRRFGKPKYPQPKRFTQKVK